MWHSRKCKHDDVHYTSFIERQNITNQTTHEYKIDEKHYVNVAK